METALQALPGMTRRAECPAGDVRPLIPLNKYNSLQERPIIVIATASITDENIFNNGLQQNCFLIQKMAEAIGQLPIFVVNTKPKTIAEVPPILHGCRITVIDDLVKSPIPVKIYLEIGMSMDTNIRRFFKALGARNAKLQLGNILNIDVETPMFFPSMHFSHHVVGEQSEIWVSPHYKMHDEQAAVLNRCDPKKEGTMKIAPQIWEPSFLFDDGRRQLTWKAPPAGAKPCFLIMEPNISFQKTSYLPLLIAEKQARDHPNQEIDVILLNGDRFLAAGYFDGNLKKNFTIAQKGQIQVLGRTDMISAMTKQPHAIPICHHWNNEQNQMVLEFMAAGFPVLHNCDAWKEFGQYQDGINFDRGAEILVQVLNSHANNLALFKSHTAALQWRHSLYNPENQKAWKALLDGQSAV